MDEPKEPNDEEVEIFERIPWDSLEASPDRRWLLYVLAGAILLGAVGVSIGRQMGAPAAPVTPSTLTVPTTAPPVAAVSVPPPPPSTTPAEREPEQQMWSEADLMALPEAAVENSAATLAEWYVTDYFTRDEPGEDRSFVEWVGMWEMEWLSPALVRTTVLVRRLAATGDEPYRRLDTEAWEVVTRLGDGGWEVAGGPFEGEVPDLSVELEAGVVEDPAGEPRHAEVVEWTDPAGVVWTIQEWKE